MRADFETQIHEKARHIRQIHDVTEVLFTQPYSRIEFYVKAGIGTRKTVSSYLKTLEELGLIKTYRIMQHTLYINEDLLNLLSKHEI